jgi:hypothetical protein
MRLKPFGQRRNAIVGREWASPDAASFSAVVGPFVGIYGDPEARLESSD